MATIDKTFADICNEVLKNGKEYENKRRGVKRLQIPSYTFRHEFKDGFPILTNKKMSYKNIVGELIWFLRSDNNVKYLNDNGITIWNADAYNWHKKITENPLTQEEFNKLGSGSVGRNYSKQWRDFNGIDQIQNLVDDMKADIMGSRLIVSAWNPSELDQTALPPCHIGFQVIGIPLEDGTFGFELHWQQRAVDLFLGFGYNIASYATLAKILEKITGYKALAIEASAKCVHFYDNQYDAAKLLLSRDVNKHPNCDVFIPEFTDFESMDLNAFKLIGYTCDDAIKVDMLAPLQ